MTPQRQGLLDDLSTVLWDTMRVLADEADDAGEEWLAAGWRWLAEKKALPMGSLHYGRRVWVWGDQGSQQAELSETDEACAWYLPRNAYRLLPPYPRNADLPPPHSEKLEVCLLAGATAVGQWLREEAQKEKRKNEPPRRTLPASVRDLAPGISPPDVGVPVFLDGVQIGHVGSYGSNETGTYRHFSIVLDHGTILPVWADPSHLTFGENRQ